MKQIPMAVGFFLLLLASGCASSYSSRFSPPLAQITRVTLTENDFVMVQPHVVGTADCSYLFGLPQDDPRIFSVALRKLYGQCQENLLDRSSQLVNWTADYDTRRFLFWTQESVTFSADLIHFKK